jgi:hypothetical protein
MARSQPNLVINTTDEVPNGNGRTSMDAGGGLFSAGGLAPPPLVRTSSSIRSVGVDDGGSEEREGPGVKGVYDTSSKQRVPSWYVHSLLTAHHVA